MGQVSQLAAGKIVTNEFVAHIMFMYGVAIAVSYVFAQIIHSLF